MAILQNGQMPGDDLLAAAGLSAEDAAKMMAQVKASGNGNGNGNNNSAQEKARAELLTAAGQASNISTASNVVKLPTDASLTNEITNTVNSINKQTSSASLADKMRSSATSSVLNSALTNKVKKVIKG